MNAIIPFVFEGAEVRGALIDGEPHLVGKDVAERLGYANTTDAISRHCKGVVKRYPLQTVGGLQELRVLAGPDVLRLIMGSKLPAAEKFERWVFEEVLPTILKTGAYTASKVDAVEDARRKLGAPQAAEAKYVDQPFHDRPEAREQAAFYKSDPDGKKYLVTLREAVELLTTTWDFLEYNLCSRGWIYPIRAYPFHLIGDYALDRRVMKYAISVEPRKNGRDRLIVQPRITAAGLVWLYTREV